MRGTAVASLVGSLLFVALTGCGVGVTAPSVADTGAAIRGVVHGGQQPVSGAHIYLYAANTTGYGGYGITASSANASVSLLKSSVLTNNAGSAGVDSSGNYYVVTDAHGGFTVSSDYSCTAGQQVYLYAIGGNPGAGTNSAAAFLAILGACPSAGSFAAGTNVFMNVRVRGLCDRRDACVELRNDARGHGHRERVCDRDQSGDALDGHGAGRPCEPSHGHGPAGDPEYRGEHPGRMRERLRRQPS
jgi:hypothetical protein